MFLRNITINFGGGGRKEVAYLPVDSLHRIPEHPKEYPEFSMFGELPAWGLFLRHTEGVHLRRVRFRLKEADYRPMIVRDDAL